MANTLNNAANKAGSIAKPLPSWDVLTKHDIFPEADHDEVARLNFLTHLNVHLSANV